VAAACARGRTVMRGLAELRVKESDRLAGIAEGLQRCGVRVTVEADDLIVEGAGKPPAGGARIETRLDHRIAMAFLVLGLAADQPPPARGGAAARRIDPMLLDDPRLLSEEVAQASSVVAAIPRVRAALLAFQRDFAAHPPGSAKGAVLDGRDIGTAVCPDAAV